MSYHKITPAQAKEMMQQDPEAVILDVRTEEEFAEGHIPGAVLIPHQEVPLKAEKVLHDKAKTILVYCRSGVRSRMAADALLALGFDNIYDLGGILSWPYEIQR